MRIKKQLLSIALLPLVISLTSCDNIAFTNAKNSVVEEEIEERLDPDALNAAGEEEFKCPTLEEVTINKKDYLTNKAIKPIEVPHIYINTENNVGITSKYNYVNCTVSMDNCENQYQLSNVTGQVRVRGNSTANLPKKPYRFKFDKKISFFGHEKNKSWCLLADYRDPSSMHNWTALGLSKKGYLDNLPYEFVNRHVRVYVNGSYTGLYLLTENCDEKAGRLNMAYNPADYTYDKQGFIAELDASAPDDSGEVLDKTYFKFNTPDGSTRYIGVKYPEVEDFASETAYMQFFNGVKSYFNNLATALYSGDFNNCDEYIDQASLIDQTIIDQLLGETDHSHKSFKFYRLPGEKKLRFGPPWDYDLALSSDWRISICSAIGKFRTSYVNWIGQKYFATEQAKKAIAKRWLTRGVSVAKDTLSRIEIYSKQIDKENKLDAQKWYVGTYGTRQTLTSNIYELVEKNYEFLKEYIVGVSNAMSQLYIGVLNN